MKIFVNYHKIQAENNLRHVLTQLAAMDEVATAAGRADQVLVLLDIRDSVRHALTRLDDLKRSGGGGRPEDTT